MSKAKIKLHEGKFLIILDDNSNYMADSMEIEPAPTQEGCLIWVINGSYKTIIYIDKNGEPVDAPLVEYIGNQK